MNAPRAVPILGWFDFFSGYEEAWMWADYENRFTGFIAIHNTNRGPALGGCRRMAYPSPRDACFDVARLARGMTYKAAMTDYFAGGLPLGGGKAVMMLHPGHEAADRRAQYRSMGRFVEALSGRFYTGEDVGTKPDDVLAMGEETACIVGALEDHPFHGNPGPFTAEGVYHGLRGASALVWGTPELAGRSAYITGLGGVGMPLLRALSAAGVRLFVSNRRATFGEREALAIAEEEIGATVVPLTERGTPALFPSVEIYAPCALGGILNEAAISEFPEALRIVGGSANNQLLTPERDGPLLQARGIYYCVDYVINNRGLWDVYHQLPWVAYDAKKVWDGCRENAELIYEIGVRAQADGVLPHEVADTMSETIWRVKRT